MYLYFLLIRIAALFNAKARRLVQGQKSVWSDLERLQALPGDTIWFHAASVGEFEQARPIIEMLRRRQPYAKILLTFFSPSGYEMRKDYKMVDVVCYLPFATRKNVRRFLQLVQPKAALFIKYEYWPQYLKQLKKAEVPTYSVSSIFMKSQAFFRWWGAPYRRLLGCFTHLFVQDEASRELLEKYGITQVSVTGDTRFDRVHQIVEEMRDPRKRNNVIPQVARFIRPEMSPLANLGHQQNLRCIVAGSTWPEDERLLKRYIDEHEDVLLLLIPHEIDDAHLHYIFNLFEGRLVRLTEATLQNVSTNRVLLVDAMGLLVRLYPYGQVTYVGGGFGVGIHNTIEAATWGRPVVFGPNYQRFREAHGLIACGAGHAVSNYDELRDAIDDALANVMKQGFAAKNYVESELGATEKIYQAIF